MTLPIGCNGCTLFGVMLGYPYVYYYSEQNHHLSMVDLLKVQVMRNEIIVMSFTVPLELVKNDSGILHKWKESIQLQVTDEIVALASLTL